jgi:hypothetical protein
VKNTSAVAWPVFIVAPLLPLQLWFNFSYMILRYLTPENLMQHLSIFKQEIRCTRF